ncbi:hypothetical protein [Natronospira bacteriovora]|uniref:Uncharacterized protein n=1 Tax=Natronospira bacteriovora TaxID=3069753 RepID=A0ABU0W5K5_9GAMM|nr:hypothetical protein [Natronospira sp. AB-CW4]MDQ2069294.1 hypothetical protein [Natronospira sp. AB-CW4]
MDKKLPILVVCAVLAGCGGSPEEKIASHLNETSAVLEFGWEVSDVRFARDQYYAHISLPGQYDLAGQLPRETENAVQGLCPAGEQDAASGDFWRGEDRFDAFRLIASNT